MKRLSMAVALAGLAGVFCLGGCGKAKGPKFWWDDQNKQKMDEGYQLPPPPQQEAVADNKESKALKKEAKAAEKSRKKAEKEARDAEKAAKKAEEENAKQQKKDAGSSKKADKAKNTDGMATEDELPQVKPEDSKAVPSLPPLPDKSGASATPGAKSGDSDDVMQAVPAAPEKK